MYKYIKLFYISIATFLCCTVASAEPSVTKYQVTVTNDSDKDQMARLGWWPQDNNYTGQPPNMYSKIPQKSSMQFIYTGQLPQLIVSQAYKDKMIITPCSNNQGYGCVSYGLELGGGCLLEYGWNVTTQLCDGKVTPVNADRGEKVNCTGGVANGGKPDQNNMCIFSLNISPVPDTPPKHYEVVIDNNLFTDLYPQTLDSFIKMPMIEDGMSGEFTFDTPTKGATVVDYWLRGVGDQEWAVKCEYMIGWNDMKHECFGTSKQIGGVYENFSFRSTCGEDAYAIERKGDTCRVMFNIAAGDASNP